MKKHKIGVFGSGGRMGKEIAQLLGEHPRLEAAVGVDRHGRPGPFAKTIMSLQDPAAKDVDLWIDFSSAEAMDEILDFAEKNARPLVSGTTGISEDQKKRLKKASASIPLLWASNMSLGVAVLNEALKLFAKLEGFDFQIEEIHHRRKKDKPSGTALSLQESLKAAVGNKVPEPLAMRGGGVFGVHKAWAFSDEEVLMFEHQALNRAVFARGSLKAAEWLLEKEPGLYGMQDVLGGH